MKKTLCANAEIRGHCDNYLEDILEETEFIKRVKELGFCCESCELEYFKIMQKRWDKEQRG